jgi:flagella basal body P-ring formation protein FlgA
VHKRSGRIKKGWARIELVEFGKVVVAAVDLEAGEIIEAGHLRVEERPRTEANVVQVEPTYLLGSRVVLARQAGEALRDSDVSMPMPIARGTEVRVIVRRGGVVVATSGVLETKSMVGSPARVRVSGKLLSGKLMSSDLVELGGVL